MADDLVTRLRGGVYGIDRIALCAEAAEAVAALVAENERLRAALQYAQSGFALAYDAATKRLNDEVLLHTGHHEARAVAALTPAPKEKTNG